MCVCDTGKISQQLSYLSVLIYIIYLDIKEFRVIFLKYSGIRLNLTVTNCHSIILFTIHIAAHLKTPFMSQSN